MGTEQFYASSRAQQAQQKAFNDAQEAYRNARANSGTTDDNIIEGEFVDVTCLGEITLIEDKSPN